MASVLGKVKDIKMDQTSWSHIKAGLKVQIGADAYKNWIAPLDFLGIDNQIADIAVSNNFIGDYVQRSFGDHLLKQFAQQNIPVQRLRFVLSKKDHDQASSAPKAMPKEKALAHKATHLGGALNKRLTFDNFVIGGGNELAHAAARHICEADHVSFTPLFLHGVTGVGKTHLLQAIAWAMKTKNPGGQVLYLSAEHFMYRFVEALRNKDTHRFKEKFRAVDMLLIDDVQFIVHKKSTQEEFLHTFNALVDQGKKLIIAGNRAPFDMDGLDDRIKSRLQMGLAIDMQPADYTLRLGILESKAAQHIKNYRNVCLDEGVLPFIAQHCTDPRVSAGALNRLFALGQMANRAISLDMCRTSLADILRANDRKLSIDTIMRKICDYYDVTMTDIISARRSRSIARPRQVAMFLCKTLTTKSLPEIGRSFGKRDHTTVIHAIKKIQDLCESDHKIAQDLERLRRDLKS